ncbi:hypothetical protein BH11PSE13_BH11PSE13_12440 [soil metagenome]
MSRDLLPHETDAWVRTSAPSAFRHRPPQSGDFEGFAGAVARLCLYAVLLVFIGALLIATLPGAQP